MKYLAVAILVGVISYYIGQRVTAAYQQTAAHLASVVR